MSDAIIVTRENFARAETARMFKRMARKELNKFSHRRDVTKINQQNIIRMNRDTLYSAALVDISQGATVTLPDSRGRYMAAEVLDEGHYVHRVIAGKGTHTLLSEEIDSTYVVIIVRFFFDPDDQADVSEVHALQNQLRIEASSSQPYSHPSYDRTSFKTLYKEATSLGETMHDTVGMFGAKEDVDPLRHFVGAAVGWGGLPAEEAFYVFDAHPREAIPHCIDLRDAPVDAFWSITVYDASGFLQENVDNSYNLNSVTIDPTEPTHLAVDNKAGYKNYLHIFEGWNYVLRFYRPRPEILDGSWQPPEMLPRR